MTDRNRSPTFSYIHNVWNIARIPFTPFFLDRDQTILRRTSYTDTMTPDFTVLYSFIPTQSGIPSTPLDLGDDIPSGINMTRLPKPDVTCAKSAAA